MTVDGLVVIPAAPALVPGLMGAASPELDDLRAATLRELRRIFSRVAHERPAVPWVMAADGRHDAASRVPGRFAGAVSTADFGRDVVLPPLPGAAMTDPDPDVPTGMLAARWALGELATDNPTLAAWASLTWCGEDGPDRPADTSDRRPGLLIVAGEGSTGHGAKAPAGERPGAPIHDAALLAALESGDPARLTQWDADAATQAGARPSQLWPRVGELLSGRRWVGHACSLGVRNGVGYLVASWVPG